MRDWLKQIRSGHIHGHWPWCAMVLYTLTVLPFDASAENVKAIEVKSIHSKEMYLYDENGEINGNISREELLSKITFPFYVPIFDLKYNIYIPVQLDKNVVYLSQRDLIVKRPICISIPTTSGNETRNYGPKAYSGDLSEDC